MMAGLADHSHQTAHDLFPLLLLLNGQYNENLLKAFECKMLVTVLQLVLAVLITADSIKQQPLTSLKGGKSDLLYE